MKRTCACICKWHMVIGTRVVLWYAGYVRTSTPINGSMGTRAIWYMTEFGMPLFQNSVVSLGRMGETTLFWNRGIPNSVMYQIALVPMEPLMGVLVRTYPAYHKTTLVPITMCHLHMHAHVRFTVLIETHVKRY